MRHLIHGVVLLGLIVTFFVGCGAPKPDLVPYNHPQPDPNKPGETILLHGFCVTDAQNRLVIYVRNQSKGLAPSSTTKIEFGSGQIVELETPAIEPYKYVELEHIEFPNNCFDPDCGFKITVDSKNQIEETNENNNDTLGICIG